MKQFKLTPSSNAEVIFDEEKHLYTVLGMPKFGPNQLMGLVGLGLDFDKMSGAQADNIRKAGALGKSVHAWTHIYDEGKEKEYEAPQAHLMPYVDSWLKFKKELGVEILEIEKPHYSEYGDYCGIPDRAVLVECAFPYIIDIKTAKTINENCRLQTMAYTYFYKQVLRRMLVQLKDDGNYKIYDDGKYGKAYLDDAVDHENWEAVLRVSNLVRKKK